MQKQKSQGRADAGYSRLEEPKEPAQEPKEPAPHLQVTFRK